MSQTESVRLSKRLAEQQSCSRREAELYIEAGHVQVDGQVVLVPGTHIGPDQQIRLAPGAKAEAIPPVTLLLHKPAGHEAGPDGNAASLAPLLSPATQSPDDRSGIRPLKKHFSSVELVTPLATPASGLVVLTQDWRVTRKLREDARVMEHEVVVDVSGDIKPGGLDRLNRVDHGFTHNGVLLPPAKVSWQNETRLRFALKGEVPGQIAYMCESVGLKVEGMKRLRIGRVAMSQLQPGQWRYLLPHERF